MDNDGQSSGESVESLEEVLKRLEEAILHSSGILGIPNGLQANLREIAANLREITANPRKIAVNPRKIAANPRKIAANPREIAANPREIATNPHEISPQGHTVSPRDRLLLRENDAAGMGALHAMRLSKTVWCFVTGFATAIMREGAAFVPHGKAISDRAFPYCHGRAGSPCPRCRTIIQKEWVGGRGTHFCPKCQKAPAIA